MAKLNALSILLIVLTPICYIPQYRQLLLLRSSAGISISALSLNTLVFQGEVATMYYLFKLAPLMRHGIPIASPPSARDWLNLTQVLVQWCCSLLLLTLVITSPNAAINNPSASGTAAAASRDTPLSNMGTVTLLICHALFFLLSIPVGGRGEDVIFHIISNINASIVNPIMTLSAVIAFAIQARFTWNSGETATLNKPALVLQIITFLALAVSWPFRLILPRNMWHLSQPAILIQWYPWVGWACVNSAVVALGQATVLYVVLRTQARSSRLESEREPLVAT